MKKRHFTTVRDITASRLCMGCGACAQACVRGAIILVDIMDQGIRPIVQPSKCIECGMCIDVCPGIALQHADFDGETIATFRKSWGPVLQLWEGYAADPEIRFRGASGGVVTSLALFCLQEQNMGGVLHTGANPQVPWRNMPVFSRNREQLLSNMGSRYSPAGPLEKLDWIGNAQSACVFIGKPCDVAALRKLQRVNRVFDEKVCLAISIFCAGTPTTDGTYHLLGALGVGPNQVEELRYRGYGWPGMTTVKIKSSSDSMAQMSYTQAWGSILSKYHQFRCYLCPDSTGEFADIACGDAWHRGGKANDDGWSLILARTEAGKKVIESAIRAGYIKARQVEFDVLVGSQKSLLNRRRNLWGRLLAMRLLLVPIPRYVGFNLRSNWSDLAIYDKIRSVAGAIKRLVKTGRREPVAYTA